MPHPAGEPIVIPDLSGVMRLPDDEVMHLQRQIAALRRRVDAAAATVAGEIARRSTRDLGYTGLAQRVGARTPEKLVARLAGMSGSEARAMVTVGEALGSAGVGSAAVVDGTSGDAPWLRSVAAAVAAGELSVAAAAAIRSGLGTPSGEVSASTLANAADRLVEDAGTMSPEAVAARARQARDELDAVGVADREAVRRDRRHLRLIPQADGMTRLIALLDPESAALITDAIDRITMPRRGGVRFVDPGEQARAEAIIGDSRTTEQLALDAVVEMIRLAGQVDDGRIFGDRAPAVRVHVAVSDLVRQAGAAEIEGQAVSVSVPTAERQMCTTGFIPILFDDDGHALKLGRTSRRFTPAQRIALAARDGGCLIDGCDRPPSWCEAHHIDEWHAHRGKTDVDDGVLLCRHHHMWVHNTGARITRTGATYEVHAADGSVRELRSKNRVRRAASRRAASRRVASRRVAA